jgi:hypothetical protein
MVALAAAGGVRGAGAVEGAAGEVEAEAEVKVTDDGCACSTGRC